MADRAAVTLGFLHASGWAGADRSPLAGDASPRRYERLRRGAERAVLMDAPPVPGGDSVADFVAIARHLRRLGLSAPEVLAADMAQGLLLLEDLGDDLFARLLVLQPDREAELYTAAVAVLAVIQRAAVPPGLPDLSADDWSGGAMLALDAYAPAVTGMDPADTRAPAAALAEALHRYADGPRVLILRDYHAENLLWLPDRAGPARVGLLDFQLAQSGQPGYDLVSLLQDARREVAPQTETAMVTHFADLTGRDHAALAAAHAVLGALRALRIIGVFARLAVRDGKTGYLDLLPRVWRQLQRNLARPELAGLSRSLAGLLPPPDPANLDRIRTRCRPTP